MSHIVTALRAAGCVFAEDEARLLAGAAAGPAELQAMLARRIAGEPLEHIVGWVDFCGLRIAVGPGVFVPRQRTRLLVREAAAVTRPGAVVVDLACGCGAVGMALAARVAGIELHAADLEPAAVAVARRNLEPLGARVYAGDLFAALPGRLRGRVDVLVANVPYVPSEAVGLMPPEARDHEPRLALDGGADGLDVLRRLAAEAPGWLTPRGSLLVESGEAQVATGLDIMARAGFAARAVTDEDLYATVLVAVRDSNY
jgi:release factor glutamine methyltransferase